MATGRRLDLRKLCNASLWAALIEQLVGKYSLELAAKLLDIGSAFS